MPVWLVGHKPWFFPSAKYQSIVGYMEYENAAQNKQWDQIFLKIILMLFCC